MITRFMIQKREAFAEGHEFPITGAYEKLTGKIYGEVDPKHRLNRIIVNLNKAPRNQRGRVEYSSNFCILKPVDMARGNGKIFFDAPNRGSKRILGFLNDGPEANDPSTLEHAGNGFLMRQGYTIVWCGWQGDLMPLKNWLVLNVPAATNKGKPIVANVRTEIVVDEKGVKSQPLSADERVKSYETASRDKSKSSLTVREKSYGKRIAVAANEWEFAACVKDEQSGKEVIKAEQHRSLSCIAASSLAISTSSFIPRKIHSSSASASPSCAIWFPSCASSQKTAPAKPNPLASANKTLAHHPCLRLGPLPERTFSARFRLPWIQRRREAQKSIRCHRPPCRRRWPVVYELRIRPPGHFVAATHQPARSRTIPHAYNIIKDAQTGRRDGILKRPRTDPLIFHTQTSTEYWQKRGCLGHTDGKGNDLKLPDNVRLYVIASAQHNSPFGSEPAKDDSQFLVNPLPAGDVLRALMVAMDLSVTKGIPPPPSRYPKVKDRTLAAPTRNGFPKIPGVNFIGLHNRQLFLDYGKNILRGKMDDSPAGTSWQGRLRNSRAQGRCRRQRHRRHPPTGRPSPRRHLHRLEPASTRTGGGRVVRLARLVHSLRQDQSPTAQNRRSALVA